MIKLITGAKGTGKTKIIIDMANDNVESAKGDIVFITDREDGYKFTLRHQVRLINATVLRRGGAPVEESALIGFIMGILAGNHDIETLYVDGAHRMLDKTVHDMEDFFNDIYAVAKMTDTRIVLTVSEDEDKFPAFMDKFKD